MTTRQERPSTSPLKYLQERDVTQVKGKYFIAAVDYKSNIAPCKIDKREQIVPWRPSRSVVPLSPRRPKYLPGS